MAKPKQYKEIEPILTTVNEDTGVYEVMNVLRRGITFGDFMQIVRESLLTMQEWAQILHLDARTLQRYRTGNLTFAPLQSEKILEIKILNKMGADVFGDAQRFDTWLTAQNISLGGVRPKDLLDNAFGIALIKDELQDTIRRAGMIVYRLARSKYINDLSGMGARLAGGRWNSKGLGLIYTSSSRALCMAEMAVHLPLGILPHDYCLAQIFIPDSAFIESVDIKKLPKGWNQFPAISATQKLGDKFILGDKHLVLKVPSAVVQGDFNYLINPFHVSIKKIKIQAIESFTFDKRLFKR